MKKKNLKDKEHKLKNDEIKLDTFYKPKKN